MMQRSSLIQRGFVAIATLSLFVAACSDSDRDGSPSSTTTTADAATTTAPAVALADLEGVGDLHIGAADFSFDLPATVPAGWTRVELTNGGDELHHATIFRMEEGAAVDALVGGGFLDPTGIAVPVGGPNSAPPGEQRRALVELEPGHYVVLCLIPSADGVVHFAKGMQTEFDVTETATALPAPAAPTSTALHDFSFEPASDFDGTGTMLVRNDGVKFHELAVIELLGDATLTEVIAEVRTTPAIPETYADVGGTTMMAPGAEVVIDFDEMGLEPGRYAFICFLVDTNEGKQHFDLGMVDLFTVT